MSKLQDIVNWLRRPEVIILSIILVVSLFIKLTTLDTGYSFEWDQEDDANKVMSMIWDKKPVLIGPRVASENGFFVGPYHYYFLLPFFAVLNGNPLAGAMAAIAVSLFTTVVYFIVGRNLYSSRVGLIAAAIFGLSNGLTSWNVMYTPLIGVVGYFLIAKLLISKKWFVPSMAFAGLAANIHLVPASLTILVLIAIMFSKERPDLKEWMKGIFMYCLFFLPLFIFDLRHEFLNINKLFVFLQGQSDTSSYPRYLFLQSWWRNFVLFGIGNSPTYMYVIDRILAMIVVFLSVLNLRHNRSLAILTLIWIILPLVFLSFYKGNIPEYYYGLADSILPLLAASLIVSIPLIIQLSILVLVFFNHLNLARTNLPAYSLKSKEKIVKYLVDQRRDEHFNVSYNLPNGWANGYEYLFKWLGRVPDRTSRGHLYSIVQLPTDQKGELVISSGGVGLIRR